MRSLKEKIFNKFIQHDNIPLWREKIRGKKQNLIFTNGVFDILHKGHIDYLIRARELGDKLIVALNSDRSVKRIKGAKRPINELTGRIYLVSALEMVDAVTFFEEDNPIEIIKKIKPDIHVKGGDYQAEELVEARSVKDLGGKIIILPFVEGHSTTSIIKRMKE